MESSRTRGRGSVESSGPAVPVRENRGSNLAGISTPSVAISSRPAAQRLASRKPNLTVDAVASANTVNSGAFSTLATTNVLFSLFFE